jgi:hypothetical protein
MMKGGLRKSREHKPGEGRKIIGTSATDRGADP